HANSARGQRRANQEHSAQQHGDNATEKQDAMAGELRLQYEERDSEQYQKHTGEIHRQQLHGIQSEQRADSANHAGSDYSGMGKFGVQAENANDQQDEEYVGLNDSGEEFLPPGQFKLRQGVVVQGQLCRFSVEARDFAAVQGMQEFVSV